MRARSVAVCALFLSLGFGQPVDAVAAGLLDSSFTADAYEKKDSPLDEKKNFFVVDSQIIQGGRSGEQIPIRGDVPFAKIISDATVTATTESFKNKGYMARAISDIELSGEAKENYYGNMGALWTAVTRYSNEGKGKKRDLVPYSIKPYIDKIGIFEAYDGVVFIQCYGEYGLSKDDISMVALDATVGAAVFAATNVLVIPTMNSQDNMEYKVSIYETQTGTLVWYREGVEADSDPRNSGRIMRSFYEFYDWHLPKAKHPQSDQKFKIKRSELLNQRKDHNAQ